MSQLALDLLAHAAPSLDNFVAGANRECVERLRALDSGAREIRFVYVWGAPGSGRSHLLAALAGGERVLTPGSPIAAFSVRPEGAILAADDVDAMDAERQEALFHLFNRVQADAGSALVTAGTQPPLALPVREDLRTRLGWGLVFELQLLSDQDKAQALQSLSTERGVAVSADVFPWMLTHRSRDIRALLAEFDAIDRYALARKRPITVALLREWLQDDSGRAGSGRPGRD